VEFLMETTGQLRDVCSNLFSAAGINDKQAQWEIVRLTEIVAPPYAATKIHADKYGGDTATYEKACSVYWETLDVTVHYSWVATVVAVLGFKAVSDAVVEARSSAESQAFCEDVRERAMTYTPRLFAGMHMLTLRRQLTENLTKLMGNDFWQPIP
jgi:hypothetical protein